MRHAPWFGVRMNTIDRFSFLSGGGDMGHLMRTHDWEATAIGSPETWPQSLRTAVRIMLTSMQPIWIGWGPDLIYLYNEPYKSIIGGKHPWALGKPTREVWAEIWHDIDPLLATAMKGDEGTYVEEQLLIMERNGYPEETYYTFSYSPIPNDDGSTGGIICANTDDTQRVIGERQITALKDLASGTVDARTVDEACRRSSAALGQTPSDIPFAALYLLEHDGTFRRAGASGVRPDHPLAPPHIGSTGDTVWPLAEAVQRRDIVNLEIPQDQIDPDLSGSWDQPATDVALVPIPGALDTGNAGVLVTGLNPFRLLDDSYCGFLSLVGGQIGTAIANAAAYEEERSRAEALAEIDKAKTAFFSNVSHEFRTPLTLMLGPLEDALAEAQDLPRHQVDRLDVAHRNSVRLLRLVNSLLDFSRIEAGRVQASFRPSDLAALTADLASSFRAATDRAGLLLEVDAPPLSEPVHLDAEMWEKIVLNLLSNAFKFTMQGRITVRLCELPDKARLIVSDTGIGIPTRELPKLFERFHRVEGAQGRSFEGSGIGLALVSELVKQHGGKITADSIEGTGTTFTVDIPKGTAHLPAHAIVDAVSAPRDAAAAEAYVEEALRWLPRDGAGASDADTIPRDANSDQRLPKPVVDGEKIVVADDNADMRDYVARLLRDRGYEVTAVADGAAALTAIRADRPDLLVSDVMMPTLDGFGVLREIRSDPDLKDLTVILLSARSGEESRVDGLDAGADDYLIKPFSARELLARVDSHIVTTRQHRETTAALRASEMRFRALASSTSDVIFRMSPDWQRLGRLDGRDFIADVDEENENWLVDYTYPEDHEALRATIAQAITSQDFFEFESRVRRADGTVGWALSRAIPILNEDGEVTEWFGMAADITVRKETEAALRESEARFRNMADHSPLMMWVTAPDGRCTYLNKSWYDFTGQTKAEGEGFGWLDAVHPDDQGWSGEVFQAANAKREPFRLEYRLRDKNGYYRWAIDAASPRFGLNGEFLGYIGSVLDIDERRRQESLRALQNRLLELVIQDRPLPDILEELALAVEAQSEMLVSLLLTDANGERLLHGAAPSLPAAYNDVIDGLEIAEGLGSCGAAAFRKQPVYVTDISVDPGWVDFRDLAAEHGLAACWSSPILSASQDLLGTFALYYQSPRSPTESDLELISLVTHTAALAIERKRVQDALGDEKRLLETLNRTGTLLAGELDLQTVVQSVTDAGVDLTGAEFGAFFYNKVDEAGETYQLYTLSGVDPAAFEKFPMPRNTEIFAPTFGGKGIVRADDIKTDPRYGKNAPNKGMPDGHLPVASYLAVPVISNTGEVTGGLFFGHKDTGVFTERHEQLMEGIAGQAAVALDNATLYRAAQHEIEHRKVAEEALQQLNENLETRVTHVIKERHKAEEALRQAQKMESIGQLTGGVAHDFNNLLQVISGNLQLLGKAVAGEERSEAHIRNALAGVSRGSKLASQLLAFGRRQPLEPKVINIGRLVTGLDDMLRRTLGDEVEVQSRMADDLWTVFADPNQIENALLNMTINARDAMAGQGKLTVEIENAALDEVYARSNPDVVPGQFVVLSVSDTGSGMPPEVMERVFEPFFTTKPEGHGTGLGLSMVYGFARQSNGHVKIYSEQGEGTTIKLYLPRAEDEEESTEVHELTPVTGGDETILVVEDDEGVRATAVEMLTDLGYRVLKAPEASSALAIVESGVAIDMLFTDVMMPGPLRSTELVKKTQALMPGIAVLYTSGYSQDAIVHGGRLDEGVNLLPKPYPQEALARKVRAVLDARSADPDIDADAPPALVTSTSRTLDDQPTVDTGPTVAAPIAHGSPEPQPDPTTDAGRILLVEDDALIRMGTAAMLEDLGHDVAEAGRASDALTTLQASSYAVLVTDIGLPDASGVELAAQARDLAPDLGVVFATGRDALPEGGPDVPGAVILTKPYSTGALRRAIEDAAKWRA